MESPILVDTQIQADNFLLKDFEGKVWNNPVLNSDTIDHRNKMVTQFKTFLDLAEHEEKVDPLKVVAFPMGSVLWNVEPEASGISDFDFMVVCADKETREKLSASREKLMEKENPLKLDMSILFPYDVNNISSVKPSKYDMDLPAYLPFALITPDKYIAGNIGFAHKIKYDFSEAVKKFGDNDKMRLWKAMNYKFKAYWVNWPKRKDEYSGTGTQRFNKYLDDWAKQFRPELRDFHKAEFLGVLDRINLPPIEAIIK